MDETTEIREEFRYEPTQDEVSDTETSEIEEESDSEEISSSERSALDTLHELALQIKQEEGMEILTTKRRSVDTEDKKSNDSILSVF